MYHIAKEDRDTDTEKEECVQERKECPSQNSCLKRCDDSSTSE